MHFYKRLCAYVRYDVKNFVLESIYLLYNHLYGFISAIVVKQIIDSIQAKNLELLELYLFVFAGAALVLYLLIFTIQPRFQIFWGNITNGLHHHYLPKLIRMDNNEYE